MKAKRNSPEELGRFVNALRDCLGLEPLHRPRSEVKGTRGVKKRQVELEVVRFAVTRPDPWHPSRTPIRSSEWK